MNCQLAIVCTGAAIAVAIFAGHTGSVLLFTSAMAFAVAACAFLETCRRSE